MCVSQKTVSFLRNKGCNAIHLREKNLQRAPDEAILKLARREKRAIITLDLDFGYLMAVSKDAFPSIIIFRTTDQTPHRMNSLLGKHLYEIEADILSGAIIIFGDRKIRVRKLPMDSS